MPYVKKDVKYSWIYRDKDFGISTCIFCGDILITIFSPASAVGFAELCDAVSKVVDILDFPVYFDFTPEFDSKYFVFHAYRNKQQSVR